MKMTNGNYLASRRSFLLWIGSVSTGLLLPVSVNAAAAILIVGNGDVSVGGLDIDELNAIYRSYRTSWSNGKRIIAINLPRNSSVRHDFDRKVLNMDPDDVEKYWIDRRIRGGNPPPKVLPSPGAVINAVSKVSGAVGYIPGGTKLPNGVKKLGVL